jgi:tRNA pseudouridine38-40 synthase
MVELLDARDRRLAAPTFAADGLYLVRIGYDARWGLPEFTRMMPFDANT